MLYPQLIITNSLKWCDLFPLGCNPGYNSWLLLASVSWAALNLEDRQIFFLCVCINLAWNLPHRIYVLNYEDAKKTQTKQKPPLLLYLALLTEHLVRDAFIQRHALRFLFQHRLIPGMAWEGADCQVSRVPWVGTWSLFLGESRKARFVQVSGQEMVEEGAAGAFLLLWGSEMGEDCFSV